MPITVDRSLRNLAAAAVVSLALACREKPEPEASAAGSPPPFSAVFRPMDSVRLEAPPSSPIGTIQWVLPVGGFVVLGDGAVSDLKVFDWSGRLTRLVGRAGSGPGEFRGPRAAALLSDGSLAVADDGNARITIFDSTLSRTGEFSFPGILSAVTDAPGGRIAVVALRVADREIASYNAVHLFDRSGKLIQSGCLAPRPTRPMEGNLQNYTAARVDSTVVWVSMVENVAHACDPATGVQRQFAVGDSVYVPPRFPERPFATPDQGRPWLGRQMWVNRVTGLDADRYVVRFAVFGSEGTPTFHYVLANRAGQTLAVTGPTNLWIEFAHDDELYATRRGDSGEVWLVRLQPPAPE